MLMYNLRVPTSSSTISFKADVDVTTGTETVGDKTTTVGDWPATVDISDIICKSDINVSELCRLELCPQLDVYRDQIGITIMPSDYSSFPAIIPEHTHTNYTHTTHESSTTALSLSSSQPLQGLQGETIDGTEAVGMSDDACGNNDYGDAYDDYDAPDDAYHADDTFDVPSYPDGHEETTHPDAATKAGSHSPSAAGAFSPSRPQRYSLSSTAKIKWTDNTLDPTDSTSLQIIQKGVDNLDLVANHDYTFFNTEVLTKGNAWAGARHWKFAAKRRDAAAAAVAARVTRSQVIKDKGGNEKKSCVGVEEEEEEEEVVATVTKATRGKKAAADKGMIEFSMDLVDEVTLDLSPYGKVDANILKAASANAGNTDTVNESLFLPTG